LRMIFLKEVKDNVIKDKSYRFALRMIKAYKHITQEQREFILSKQVLRSGTAIGALIRKGEHARSKADFVNKKVEVSTENIRNI